MSSEMDVAIVGMSGRFPGAANVAEFWELLRGGVDAGRQLTAAELDAVPAAERDDPAYVPVWSGIEGADQFDAQLFGYSPTDATLIDPQHRILLECAWEGLEDAGYDSRRFPGDIAVYAGCGLNQYLLYHLLPQQELVDSAGRLGMAVASDKDNLATRISYKLDLTGPSVSVQTNCSSALVGLHHAISSLLDYQCDMAIVGAVSVKNPVPRGYRHEADGVNSPDGRCRAFDAEAAGYHLGDGAGVVVLRRREDAEAAGDRIYAMVKGSAVNNDGGGKVSFTAPGRSGQVRVIRRALRVADVEPGSIQYVEANGSGTLMGDSIEVAALEEAYGASGAGWAIGSVKPNVGNLDTASGVTSLIKAVLAVHHGELPPSIHYRKPNPQTSLDRGPFRVNDLLRDWPETAGPRRAAVSSFGVGGTNAHVVLEQAPPTVPAGAEPQAVLLTVSAAGPEALAAATGRLAAHVGSHPEQSLADIAYTGQVGRRALRHRAVVVAADHDEAVRALFAVGTGEATPEGATVAYAFPATCPDLAALCAALPRLRAEVERVAGELGVDPDAGAAGADAATVTGQLALARLLAACGVSPVAAHGDGAGALTAAVVDGRWTVAEAGRALRAGTRPPAPAGAPAEADVTLVVGPAEASPLALTGDGGDLRALLGALGELWRRGVEVDWAALHEGASRRRVGLPTYPFQRSRHWIDPVAVAPVSGPQTAAPTADTAAATGSVLEEAVAAVWRRRLGVDRIGPHDSLLMLGADSLNAARTLRDLAQAFHVDLQLGVFLETPTVAALAEVIDGKLREAQEIRAALAAVTEEGA
ncbi:beta-ketoacyl synthase N-terminal-like domain-containing protein [Micromonospora sp. NPDC047074]|uniref:beta-ketoacyl synthase N-terminal-like domain-containing protein n=1 Tax=Micromonospora sp. NPDC047074 TaxID=3154339 RepID=UPI0033E8E6D0